MIGRPQSEPRPKEAVLGSEIPMNTLIRNGTVVTADETIAADVLIEGRRIKEVRAGIPEKLRDDSDRCYRNAT